MDNQLIRGSVNEQMLYAIQSHALEHSWHRPISITGFTSILKRDVTTNKDVTYRSDTNFRGREWVDWAFLHFHGSSKKSNEVNIGRIVGFFKFENSGFPTPKRLEEMSGRSKYDGTTYVVTPVAVGNTKILTKNLLWSLN